MKATRINFEITGTNMGQHYSQATNGQAKWNIMKFFSVVAGSSLQSLTIRRFPIGVCAAIPMNLYLQNKIIKKYIAVCQQRNFFLTDHSRFLNQRECCAKPAEALCYRSELKEDPTIVVVAGSSSTLNNQVLSQRGFCSCCRFLRMLTHHSCLC